MPDRLAGALVGNLPARCQFHGSGCTWTGRQSELRHHLASECPCVLLVCPSCDVELPRREMAAHSERCGASQACPYGCGAAFADAERLCEHRAACLLDPRKLLAALGHMQRENERLASENMALKAEQGGPTTPVRATPPPRVHAARRAHRRRPALARICPTLARGGMRTLSRMVASVSERVRPLCVCVGAQSTVHVGAAEPMTELRSPLKRARHPRCARGPGFCDDASMPTQRPAS